MTSPQTQTRLLLRAAFVLAALLMLALPASAQATSDDELPAAGTFTNDLPISGPNNLEPADGTVIDYPTDAVNLDWDPVPGADTYELQVAQLPSTASSCSTSSFQASSIVVDVYPNVERYVPTLLTDESDELQIGGFCWRVRAADQLSDGTEDTAPTYLYGGWATPSKFVRQWNGAPANLRFYNDEAGAFPRASEAASCTAVGSMTVNPDPTAENCVTRVAGYLKWDAVQGAQGYDVEVSNSDSWAEGSIILSREGVKGTRLLLPHLPDDTYNWRVRAVSPTGINSAWVVDAKPFQVRWFTQSWNDTANISPADNATVGQMTVGWTPLRGASYYEVQMSVRAGCFWEDNADASKAPLPWGHWVQEGAYTDTLGNIFPQPPRPSECRLSRLKFNTMNNWATLDSMWDPEVFENIGDDTCWMDQINCYDAALPEVVSEGFPGPYPKWPAGTETLQQALDRAFGTPLKIYWRVRPVYQISQATESSWQVSAQPAEIYGRWNEYYLAPGSSSVPHAFTFDVNTDAPTSTGTRCVSVDNPTGNGCLVMDSNVADTNRPTVMAAGPVDDDDSDSLQVPMFTWQQFAGNLDARFSGGYIMQIARDPDFSTINIVRQVFVPGLDTLGYGWQHSVALTDTLPDNSTNTGYWWRAVPCEPGPTYLPKQTADVCVPLYYAASAGTMMDQADGGGAQYFNKRTGIETEVVQNFTGATPMLMWYPVGSSTAQEKARGINGADHYEIRMSRNPFVDPNHATTRTYYTTVPRLVPDEPSSTPGKGSDLADGVWFYQVRAVDADTVDPNSTKNVGAWSAIASFTKTSPAPTILTPGDTKAPEPVVSWSPVANASYYQVQVSKDPAFQAGSSISTISTAQTSFQPRSTNSRGTWFWRVRAMIDSNAGPWTSVDENGPTVTVQGHTRLYSALSTTTAVSGQMVYIRGQLLSKSDVGVQGETIQILRKDTACNEPGDISSYSTFGVASQVTGADGEEGTVRFGFKADRDRCYVLAWADPSQVNRVVYSAPISLKVVPYVKMTLGATKVRRSKNFLVRLSSNAPIKGYARVQFLYRGKWTTIKTLAFKSSMTSYSFYGQINYAGTFRTRVQFYGMRSDITTATSGYATYEDTTASGPSIRVNDLFTIYYKSKHRKHH